MLTKINTYEGVPVGSQNFEEFFDYVRDFLSANFNFSTYLSQELGGYFPRDSFTYVRKGSTTQNTWFFTPSTSTANLYGSKNNEFYQFEILGDKTKAPQVYSWEVLPTKSSLSNNASSYQFVNTDLNDNKVLPYNPTFYIPSREISTSNVYTAQNSGSYFITFTATDAGSDSASANIIIDVDGSDEIIGSVSDGATKDFYKVVDNISAGNVISLEASTGDVTFSNIRIEYQANVKPGYNYVSYSGIYQSQIVPSFSNPGSGFSEQTVTIPSLKLGAESPKPVTSTGRFYRDLAYGENSALGINANELTSEFNNQLEFKYTNFSLGAFIILKRVVNSNTYYVYVPEDTKTSGAVTSGTYRVIDSSIGKVEFNLSETQLDALTGTSESFNSLADKQKQIRFFIVSAEQLLTDRRENITYYRSRHGEIYNGNLDDVELLSLTPVGNTLSVNTITENIISFSGSALFQDLTGSFDSSIVVALNYTGVPNLSEYTKVQETSYVPDVFEFYYHAGISANNPNTSSSVKAFVEENESSWYNKKSLDGSFTPVNRGVSHYISFITGSEASSSAFFNETVFDPKTIFSVADVLNLKDLGDVRSEDGDETFTIDDDGNILLYNSSENKFESKPFTLGGLTDVDTLGVTNNQVIAYNSNNGTWQVRKVDGATGILGYDPVRIGFPINGRLAYSTSVGSIGDTDSQLALANKGYVESYVNNAVTQGVIDSLGDSELVLQNERGVANGVASLDATGTHKLNEIPSVVARTDTALTEFSNDITIGGTLGVTGDTQLSGNLTITPNGATPNIDGNTIWHAGNDGDGSGLDADTIDGYDIEVLTQAQYDALPSTDPNTIYIITD